MDFIILGGIMLKKHASLWLSILGCLAVLGCAESNDPLPVSVNPGTTTPAVCGNNKCEAGETTDNCLQDCPVSQQGSRCGNKLCESDENASNCPADCQSESGEVCGDNVCSDNETLTSCPSDCTPKCGNNACENSRGEDVMNCPEDCGWCGDGTCSSKLDETSTSCPNDCKEKVYCGDSKCDLGETRLNCPVDCPPECGDGRCEAPQETKDNCAQDCDEGEIAQYESVCGDGVCDDDEKENCTEDCKPEEQPKLPQVTEAEFNSLKEGKYRFLFDYELVTDPFKAQSGESSSDAFERQMNEFFSFPFPSELRTDEKGHPIVANYPLPKNTLLDTISKLPFVGSIGDLLPMIFRLVQSERAGFSPIGASYFRTSVTIDNYDFPKPKDTLSADSCFQLINVEPQSRHYGERVPLYVSYHRAANKTWASNVLVMRPVPGAGANPGDRHISVVGNCLTANGRKLNQSNKLRYILEQAAPETVNKRMSFYVEQLNKLAEDDKLGMKLSDIRAMTGYQTLNAAVEMDQIAADLIGKGQVVTDDNGVAIGEWATTTTNGTNVAKYNVNIFRGTFKTVNYMEGAFPYTGDGEGAINFDDEGKLISKGKEETVRFTIVMPRTDMPEKGWPIAVYGHGTGGNSDTHCRWGNDEGIVLANGGYTAAGSKPTDKAVPMAMIGFDASLHGKRGEEGKEISDGDFIMMLMQNPLVVRESWRQTVTDMLVIYDLLDRGKFVLPPIPGSKDKKNVIFDPSYGMYMGHSQGSQEAGLLLGLTPKIKNAFLSAGGGGVMLSFVDLHPDLSGIQVVGNILGGKSVADMVGYLLGMNDGDISYDTFLTNHIIQPLTDPIDPNSFTRRFVMEPPAGWEPKNIVQTIGLGDQSTPQAAQFAMISQTGLPPIGEVFKVSDSMELAGFTKSTGNTVSNNVTNLDGKKSTGASIQFNYTGSDNPHFVIYDMKSARNAYIDFFKSVVEGHPTASVSGDQTGGNSY